MWFGGTRRFVALKFSQAETFGELCAQRSADDTRNDRESVKGDSSLLAVFKIVLAHFGLSVRRTLRHSPRRRFVLMVTDGLLDYVPQKRIGDVAMECEPDSFKSFAIVHDCTSEHQSSPKIQGNQYKNDAARGSRIPCL
jgi:serine/threonine protein phosphatase PrpC